MNKEQVPSLTAANIKTLVWSELLKVADSCFDAEDEFYPPAVLTRLTWQLLAKEAPVNRHRTLFFFDTVMADETVENMLLELAETGAVTKAHDVYVQTIRALTNSARKYLEDFEGDLREYLKQPLDAN